MPEELEQLIAAGRLEHFDRYFVRSLLRLAPDAGPLVLLLAALARKAVADGHLCLDLARLFAGFSEEPSFPARDTDPLRRSLAAACRSEPTLSQALAELEQSPLVCRDAHPAPLVLEGSRLYLERYWSYEEELALAIRARAHGLIEVREDLLASSLAALFPGQEQDLPQRAACAAIFPRRLGLITGGPGTGKTTLAAKYLALLLLYAEAAGEPLPRIMLLAPTGKAAARLSDSLQKKKAEPGLNHRIFANLPDTATTIHRALGFRPDKPGTFRHNRENPFACEVVVADEASMIDAALMVRLLAATPPTARLVLLGDRDQLASVEAGSILGDICEAADAADAGDGCLSACLVRLTGSYRFSSQAGIGALAGAIHAGQGEEAALLAAEGSAELALFHGSLRDRLPGDHPLAALIIAAYRPFLEAADPMSALLLFERFRLLCAHRSGPAGVSFINRYAEETLARAGLIENKNQWYKGRPVLVKANSYGLRLFNGDTGVIWPEEGGGGGLKAFFFSEDRSRVRSFSPRQLPDHETAFAMTIHKSQGSEFDRVALILPGEDSAILSRELLYTGVTRARRQITLVGRPEEIRAAVARRVERASGLAEKLAG